MRIGSGHIALAFVSGMLALAGCGGGGGSEPSAGGSATIQGSVPGTLFVAVDDATNAEAGRAAATGTGTPKTFTMTVATGKNYRFYVMENDGTANERAYPMFIGANNVFGLDNAADGQTISLGLVSPDMGTGKAIPANSPALMMSRGTSAMIPSSMAGTAFSMENVKGTAWGYHTVMTSAAMGWEHGTLSFDNNGLGHMTGIVRNGSPLPSREDIPYAMSISGMLLNPGDNTFQCVVSRDTSVMAATFTDNTGGAAMMIGQKLGGSFPAGGADMTGTWLFQRLTAGSDNVSSGWAFGTMQNVSGAASTTSMTTNAGTGVARNFAFSMDGSGVLSDAADASFHGVMSADKNMIVATDTSGGNPELWVMFKSAAGAFSTADMSGDWVMHAVSSGNPGSRGWTYGHSVVDSAGNDTFTGMTGSSGPVPTAQMTFLMNGGVMTMGGTGMGMAGGGMMGGGMMPSTFHGIMNGAKNLMVSNYSDGSGGYPFSIQVK